MQATLGPSSGLDMAAINYEKILLGLIDKLISGEWSVPEFESVYYRYVVEVIPADALSEEDEMFFCDIQETLDMTAENPDKEDRKYGYRDHGEYVAWVKNQVEKYRRGENPAVWKPQ